MRKDLEGKSSNEVIDEMKEHTVGIVDSFFETVKSAVDITFKADKLLNMFKKEEPDKTESKIYDIKSKREEKK